MFGHQLLQNAVHFGLIQQLRSTTQEHLDGCVPTSFVQEVALQQSFLLHHPASNKADAVINKGNIAV